MAKKVLITGINGFVGKHLAREFNSRGCEVMGLGREAELNAAVQSQVAQYFVCELTDKENIANLPLDDIDVVISLAGLANVGASFDNPDLYNKINVQVFSVLANRLIDIGSKARVIAVSTGAVYSADQAMPLTEESGLIKTGSPYALSKIAMENEVADLRERGLKCIVVRPFNHIGPGQEPGFLLPDLYSKIKSAQETDGIVKVGNLTTKRDYTDVRDVVRAYADLALADHLDHPTYNVCSGRSVEGEKIMNILLKESGQADKITITIDPTIIRPNDPKDLYGSNEKLRGQTSWQPTLSLEQTIADFVKLAL